MKKIGNLVKCALLALSIFAISSFEFMSCVSNPSATAVPPDWLANYRVVYPASEYIAQRGSGVSKESAQNDAISKLARYVKTSVSSNMSSFVQTVTNGTSVEETFKDIDETTVSSQAELFALETTIPYYNASDKTWYCVAYIYR